MQVGSKVGRNGGTGLGLAICKQLSAVMGGRLEVQSEFGKGSKFSVIVPEVKIAPASADPVQVEPVAVQAVPVAVQQPAVVEPAEEPAKKPAASAETASPSAQQRLLIVDDSKMNIMVLKAMLKHLGDFEIVTAMDGNEALKVLEAPDAMPFDLVLTDMWMPEMDGEGLVKAIRANPKLASLRVIVVTADVEFQSKYVEMGFNGMLLKPITAERLRAILETPTGGGG